MLLCDSQIDCFPQLENFFAITDPINFYDPNFSGANLTVGECFTRVNQSLNRESFEGCNGKTQVDSIEMLQEIHTGTKVTCIYLKVKQPNTDTCKLICISRRASPNSVIDISVQFGSEDIAHQSYQILLSGGFGGQCIKVTDLDSNCVTPNLNCLIEAYQYLDMLRA